MTASQKIITAFDRAAPRYDAAAILQQLVAQQLVDSVGGANPQTILDIGCGTGSVTRRAMRRWPQAHITALDASANMLDQIRARLPAVHTIQADATQIDGTQKYDLIFSSLLLHWLPDPRAVLQNWRKLLSPQGTLHVALPVAGSLREWRTLCTAHGINDGIWKFPEPDFADGTTSSIQIHPHALTYPTLYDFLKNLKETGAHSPHPDHDPTPTAQLRRLLTGATQPFTVTYDIAYLTGD